MKKLHFLILIYVSIVFQSKICVAEGTNPVSPNANNMSALLVAHDLGSGAYMNCPDDNRVYVDIKNHLVENIYFGFDWRQYTASGGDAPRLKNLYYRIRRPDGTVVAGPTLWNPSDIAIGSGGTGVINGYTRAFNGPNIGNISNGYVPLVFDPVDNGSFWFEFYRSNDGGVTMITTGTTGMSGNRAIAPLFDITVANNSTFQVFNGRMHSDKWAFLACEPGTYRNIASASAAPIYYAYTTDSTTVKIQFEPGFRPIAYNVAVNNYGVTPITVNNPFTVSRNSAYSATAPSLMNGYKVFLNIPDSDLYPPCIIPVAPQFTASAITGCGPYQINFQTNARGDVKIFLNLNGIPNYQEGTADRIIEASDLPAGSHTITWDGLDGLGNPVSGVSTITLRTSILKGRFNLPIYDAEINSGGINIDIIAPVFGRPDKVFWNDALLQNIGNRCSNNSENNNNIAGTGLDNSSAGVTTMPTRAWNGNGNVNNIIPAPAVAGNDNDDLQCNDFGNMRTLNLWGWGVTVHSDEVDITFGCPATTLPVSLLDFAAVKNGEQSLLKWTTSSEANSSHMDIERSADGRAFAKIGKVEAAGYSHENRDYNFIDAKPLSGSNYYRLKLVDRDGSFTYSHVRMLKFDQAVKMDVFPNPATNLINISFPPEWQTKDATIELYNSKGQRVNQMLVLGLLPSIRIKVDQLPNGTYHLKVACSGYQPETRTIQVVR